MEIKKTAHEQNEKFNKEMKTVKKESDRNSWD